MCIPIIFDNLGIKKLRLHNREILAKWLWHFGTERDSLRCRVVVARFGEQLVWESKEIYRRHGCDIWKSIFFVKVDFLRFIKFKLGSGRDIKFR